LVGHVDHSSRDLVVNNDTSDRLDRHTFVEKVPGLEPVGSRKPIVLQRGDLEAGFSNKLIDRPIEIASASDALLKSVELVLFARYFWFGRKAMFEEMDFASGAKHPIQLAERSAGIRNGAQRERAESGIHRLVVQGEILSVEVHALDRDGRCSDSFSAELAAQ
jgi:hypothetical protein